MKKFFALQKLLKTSEILISFCYGMAFGGGAIA